MNGKLTISGTVLAYNSSINLTNISAISSEKEALPYLAIAVFIILLGAAYFVITRAN